MNVSISLLFFMQHPGPPHQGFFDTSLLANVQYIPNVPPLVDPTTRTEVTFTQEELVTWQCYRLADIHAFVIVV